MRGEEPQGEGSPRCARVSPVLFGLSPRIRAPRPAELNIGLKIKNIKLNHTNTYNENNKCSIPRFALRLMLLFIFQDSKCMPAILYRQHEPHRLYKVGFTYRLTPLPNHTFRLLYGSQHPSITN